MENSQEYSFMNKFNPIPEDKKTRGPVKPVSATSFNPLDGSFNKQEVNKNSNEKNEISKEWNEVYAEKKSPELLAEEEKIQENKISEQKAKVGQSYPPPEASLAQEKQIRQNKTSFNPLDINNDEKFDMLNVDQTPKKKNFWQRLFS